MDTRKARTILLVIITITIFSLSYYVCVNKLKTTNIKNYKHQVNSDNSGISDTLTVDSNLNGVVSADANIVFKVKYIKSGEVITEKEEKAQQLAGKKKDEVDEVYKNEGYKVQNITSAEVVLIKEIDKYAPNKYVLGIKDGRIAIYKTDKDGNMFIENDKSDITDIKTDKLKEADIQLLTKGDKYFQCDTREDAESRLEDYE
jgi:dipeptidyl aminopeptidase/acylaminoacyl peptidase